VPPVAEERASPAGALFAWRPGGVGRRVVPCPRCGVGTPAAVLDNLCELLCGGCGRSLLLLHCRRVERAEGAEALAARLAALGLDPGPPPGSGGGLVEGLIERGGLRGDLRLTLELDLERGAAGYGAAPLRDLVLAEEVEQALRRRRERGTPLAESLREAVLVRLSASVRSVGREVGLPTLDSAADLAPDAGQALPRRALELYRAVPVRREGEALVVALWDPLDLQVVADLEALTGGRVRPVLAAPEVVAAALRDLGVGPADAAAEPVDDAPLEPEAGAGLGLLEEEPTLAGILLEALEDGADQVLLEPSPGGVTLRLRIRGALRKERLLPMGAAAVLAEALGALAGEASGAERAPGIRERRVRCEVSGLPLQLDYRIVGTPLGPAVALALEEEAPGRAEPALGELGLGLEALAELEGILATGRGLLVVAGPSAGGGSLGYQAVLQRAVRLGGAVVSLEGRVGRFLPGATQLELTPDLGPGLGALLRPPPDWLGVDAGAGAALGGEALLLAVDVALGGGCAVVTVTAPDARRALLRLEAAGLPRALLDSLVRAVVARRVAPRNCPRCRVRREPDPAALRALGLDPALGPELAPWVGLGCADCAEVGSSGEVPLAELCRPEAGELRHLAGSEPIAELARRLVREGDVPLEAAADLLA